MALALEIFLSPGTLVVAEVWGQLRRGLQSAQKCSAIPTLQDNRLNALRHLETSEDNHFATSLPPLNIDYSTIARWNLSFLQVKGIENNAQARSIVEPFSELPNFVYARLFDEEYDFWQNAQDPLQYQTRKRPYQHLPKKSNGMPFPLEKQIIDTDRNPGRRVFRSGYIEAIGHEMWLSLRFFELTRSSLRQIQSQSWISYEKTPGESIYLIASTSPFLQDTGEEGSLQQKLRELLFPCVA